MQQSTKDNLANRSIWARGLYMLFYVIAYAVAEAIVALVAIFQFVHALFTGSINPPLQAFSANLCAYILQILEYVTFNSEFQPFPFAEWPTAATGETPWSQASTGAAQEAPEQEQSSAAPSAISNTSAESHNTEDAEHPEDNSDRERRE